jgi:hyperosmotically inducible protein
LEELAMFKVMLSGTLLMALTAGMSAQQAATGVQNEANAPAITVDGPVTADYGKNIAGGDAVEQKIAKEVRHELLMLPYYSLFDNLGFTVQGRTVTLTGTLTSQHAVTKNEAENSVKRIEGVEKVVNNIQVLPPSPMDDRVREEVFNCLVRTGGLSKYFWEAAPSIHILVQNGHVTLTGYVMNEGDKNMAGIAAATAPGIFGQVVNNLKVVKG